jgi:hypothetical protein
MTARRWMMLAALTALGAFPHHAPAQPATGAGLEKAGDPAAWLHYVDRRTGTSVDYPADLFSEDDGPPHEGIGQRFSTADKRAQFEIYGLPNDDRDTPRSFVSRRLTVDKRILDYSRVTDRFFAISGINEGQVFYSRCNFSSGSRQMIHCVYLYYPERETKSWDAIVTRISRSLEGRPDPE